MAGAGSDKGGRPYCREPLAKAEELRGLGHVRGMFASTVFPERVWLRGSNLASLPPAMPDVHLSTACREIHMLSRRGFISLALATGAASFARAETTGQTPTILRLERRTIEVNGKAASVFGIKQPDGRFGINTEIGKSFYVRVENHIQDPSLIHWHGLKPPWQQDGVPELSGTAIPPGGTAEYDFPLPFGGTFWMHSHYGLQEQLLMSAPLIIHDASDKADQQEVVIMLADFSFTPPEQILEQLRKGGHLAHMHHMDTPADELEAVHHEMPLVESGGHVNDVKYDAFLANDRTLADPQVVTVEQGGLVLLRVINGSAMSNFHIDLGDLDADLIAVDGCPVVPVRSRILPITTAQRLDIRLTVPQSAAAYPILAKPEGERQQTGIILRAGQGQISRISVRGGCLAAPHAQPRKLATRGRAAEAARSRPQLQFEPDRLDGRLSMVDK